MMTRHRRSSSVALFMILLLLCLPGRTSAQQPKQASSKSLAGALRIEKSLLEAELTALESQREQTTTRTQDELERLRREIATQRQRYESAWAAALDAERALRTLDARLDTTPAAPSSEEQLAMLQSLEREVGVEPGEPGEEDAERLRRVFDATSTQLIAASRVRRETRTFFLSNGEQVQGPVILVGDVAAAGISTTGDAGGALVPLQGEGAAMQIIHPDGASVKSYIRGASDALPLFIYDRRDPPSLDALSSDGDPEQRPARTWRDTVEDAAPVGYVILLLGAVGLLVFLARFVALSLLTIRERKAGRTLLEIMHAHHHEAELSDLERYAKSHHDALARVTTQALTHRDMPLELYENSVHAVLIVELGRIGRGLGALRAIAAVSPLLGLLGTVIGMVETFEALTVASQVNDPQALSGGIAQALATTQLGLLVAVPTLLAYSGLRSWTARMENYIEHAAVEISTHIRELSISSGEGHHHHHHHHHHDDEEES